MQVGTSPKLPRELARGLACMLMQAKFGDGKFFLDSMGAAASDSQVKEQVVQACATVRSLKRAVGMANLNLVPALVVMKPKLYGKH